MEEKTITSLVTLPINQNIALIRISGPKTYYITEKIFLGKLPSYPQKESKLILGNIVDKKRNKIIDQVLLLCFYRPFSFTGEDVVEISCHGNLFIVNEILKIIIENGADLAREGEFTKQAFFNGKLNIIQAEAVNDLIKAPNLNSTRLALHNLNIRAQKELENIEKYFLEIVANIEVNINFPEYDGVEYLTNEIILPRLRKLKRKINIIKNEGKKSIIFQKGLKISIIGKPNVGKSTLLNSLVSEEKAIISSIPGTTRDVIEVKHSINSIPVTFLDTAGIHETSDILEKAGIKKSYSVLESSEMVFFVVDNSEIWEKKDETIINLILKKKKRFLLIINKIDKPNKLVIPSLIKSDFVVKISAKKKRISELQKKMKEIFTNELSEEFPSYPFLSKSWQQAKLLVLLKLISEIIIKSSGNKIFVDALCSDLKLCYNLVRELQGKEYEEKLIDVIFRKFCLGK